VSGEQKTIPFKDFSDRLYSVQQKFLTVSVISIFISIFDLKGSSRFFGVETVELNERLIELGFYTVATLLGLLYALRLIEERNVISQIQIATDSIVDQIQADLNRIMRVNDEAEEQFQTIPLLNGNHKKVLEHFLRSISGSIKFIPIEKNKSSLEHSEKLVEQARERVFSAIASWQDTIQNSLNKLDETNDLLNVSIRHWGEMAASLKGIHGNPIGKTMLSGQRKFRIVLFEYTLPFVVFLAISLAFVFPDSSHKIAKILRLGS